MTGLRDDPITALERELMRAAERQAAEPLRRRPRLGLPATIAAALLPILIVAGALFLTRSGAPSRPAGHAGAAGSSGGGLPLAKELGVLRRPERPSDHIGQPSSSILRSEEMRRLVPGAGIVLALERRVVVPLPGRPAVPVELTVLDGLAQRRPPALLVSARVTAGRHSFTTREAPVSATELASDGHLVSVGGGGFIVVVPDGVARVELLGTDGGRASGAVHENVAGLELGRGRPVAILWRDRRGRVIRRVTTPVLPSLQSWPHPAGGGELRSALGVLRRPQTAADRSLPQLKRGGHLDPGLGTPDRAGARLATITPWGARIYLVPFTTPTGPGQILDVFGMGGVQTMSGAAAFSAAQIDTGQAVLDQRVGGHEGGLRVLAIVPDRVATIRVTLAGAAAATGETHGNVAALVLPGRTASGRGQITWRNARGRAIGSFPWALGTR